MTKPILGIVLALAASTGLIYGRVRLGPEFSAAGEERAGLVGAPDPAERRHLASPEMISAGDRAAGSPAPDFGATGSDGGTYRLSEVAKDGPAVLVFIKDGCPCSRAADPFLGRMQAAGRGWVPFFGVIDGDLGVAGRWAGRMNTAFPILADPEMKIIRAYGAENSAYVAFVGRGGRIEKLWAGYSAAMLRELGERMRPWVRPGMEPFDVSDAPADLYAGCPY